MSGEPQADVLVSLVGNSPLPVLFGVRQFLAPGGLAVLVHSRETREEARRLARVLGGEVSRVVVGDPWSPQDVCDTIERLRAQHPGAWLNYTGGTKVMSAFACAVFADAAGRLLYLDEPRGVWHVGVEGLRRSLHAPVHLEEAICLHGGEPLPPDEELPVGPDTLRRAFGTALGSPSRNRWKDEEAVYQNAADVAGWSDATRRAFSEYAGEIFGEDLPRLLRGRSWADLFGELSGQVDVVEWARFLEGGALEVIGARALAALSADGEDAPFGHRAGNQLIDDRDIWRGREIRLNRQLTELDVLAWSGHRLHALSVTGFTNRPPFANRRWKQECKKKAFEVQHRARQLGGPLAKFGLACLVERAELERSRFAAEIDSDRFAVFGYEDFQAWLNGDYGSLIDWLEV